jgi:hypothetical protein
MAAEDVELQFARQLYERCLEVHGEGHEQTELVGRYIAALKDRDSRRRGLPCLRETTFVPLPSTQVKQPQKSRRLSPTWQVMRSVPYR